MLEAMREAMYGKDHRDPYHVHSILRCADLLAELGTDINGNAVGAIGKEKARSSLKAHREAMKACKP